MNPGAGLWSSKLHDFLKPRKHVLVEPNRDYLSFLQPLLDAPGSRYCYRDWDEEINRYPDAYVEDGLIPDVRESKREGSPILIISNYAGQKAKRMDQGLGSKAHLKAIDFTYSAKHGIGFHAYGPTRQFMWMTELEKRSLLPRSVGYRHKLPAFIESSFHAEEIVGEAPADVDIKREDALEIASAQRVAEQMAKENIVLPPERRLDFKDIIHNSSDVSRRWHRELEGLEEGFKTHKLSQYVGRPPGPLVNVGASGRKKVGTPDFTPEYDRLRLLRGVLRGENKQIEKAKTYLKIQEEIDNLDLQAHREGLDPKAQEELLATLDAKIEGYKESLSGLSLKKQYRIMFMDDDRRAFAMSPSLLMWDRRKAEPLIALPKEFYPSKDCLSLVSFEPKVPQPFPLSREQSTYFDMLATELMSAKGPFNITYLNKIAPGAFEALVPKVDALRDPRRGGRSDVESVRNRTLTPEQLHGLAIAWDQWLFKPLYLSDSMPQPNLKEMRRRFGARSRV